MENGKHIINKVFLEVNTNSVETAYHLKDHLDVFLKEMVLPYLEAYFDTFQKTWSTKGHLQVEKIAIDLSFGTSLDFSDVKEGIKKGIENELEKKRTNLREHFSSSKKRTEDTFFHFLETGSLPWWHDSKTTEIFQDDTAFDRLLASRDFIPKLRNRLLHDRFRERLIKQLGDDRLRAICERCLPSTGGSIQSITSIIDNLVAHIKNRRLPQSLFLGQRQLLWDIIFCMLLKVDQTTLRNKLFLVMKGIAQEFHKKYTDEFIEEKVVRLLDYKSADKILAALNEELSNSFAQRDSPPAKKLGGKRKKEVAKDEKQTKHEKEDMEKRDLTDIMQLEEFETDKAPSDLYVENAGLILLHPYLNQLFLNCNLLKNRKITHPEMAAHLLHYIATKREMQYEHRMVFEKFLCGIPIDRPIDRTIELTPDLKMHAEEMLQAVVANWTALGNTSVDLLRNEYLQRPGKLILTEDNPKVIVERKTQDILLEKLPWGIGLCKFPWKKKIIFTEW